ncbi:gamma-glutamyl phosphate reductase GPR [Dothidotthia symphoricarpi CBS 119687]|uniref:glutamate-5-semialdehyde dehydrogenase n=1 Tax=Dothidotthia symphoricarpi CBS 119687 TaxID=1392245 RepID=A0A6A6AVN0_9PLEO|nr:gamma-glutamyl phosphate reductase GPR [Dothidotthia symphoricarpi CBS 119687]KAF2135014.1 gamma-glutamyl phosphate reductase GPR [Dothidotthia symphoricarpi CBS 119687]
MSLTNATPLEIAQSARVGSRKLAVLSTEERNAALTAIHDALANGKEKVLAANAKDLEAANQAAAGGTLSASLVKRLDLGKPGKYEDMLQGILDVRELDDPINKTTAKTLLDDNLTLSRITCPIGVLLIIFEARPEVIANISALALKSGNAAILKGGRESSNSFAAIASIISDALSSTSVPPACLQLVQTHDVIADLLKQDTYIDLCIPRGGNKLVRYVKDSTAIPVLGHADGICSIYLRGDYPADKAAKIILDAKASYPAGCNAAEQLLVDESALRTTLPAVAEALLQKGVSLRCDPASLAALREKLSPHSATILQEAGPEDFDTEFLDYIMAVKTVNTLDDAVSHINTHGSHHTDAILTLDESTARAFLAAVDSSSVYWNTSTRMADGQRYGFGTEVGISTNKIHSRGPVGLEGLCIYKWVLIGDAQVSAEYGAGGKQWKHQKLAVGDDEGVARNEEEREVLRRFRAGK